MKIAIGCDHGALDLKNQVARHLEGKGYEVKLGACVFFHRFFLLNAFHRITHQVRCFCKRGLTGSTSTYGQ